MIDLDLIKSSVVRLFPHLLPNTLEGLKHFDRHEESFTKSPLQVMLKNPRK